MSRRVRHNSHQEMQDEHNEQGFAAGAPDKKHANKCKPLAKKSCAYEKTVTTFQFRAYTEAISFHSDAELLESVLPSHPLCLTAKLPWDSISPAEAQFSIDFFALGSVLGLA